MSIRTNEELMIAEETENVISDIAKVKKARKNKWLSQKQPYNLA